MAVSLTVSAVDNTTDQITITAHGLSTGAGPAAILVGAGGVIPTGLSPATDVWIIRVDANTIKLATSSANAFANTPINITANGTLPLSLQLGIPYRRATSYVAGSQIKSADLDAIQDALVAIHELFTAQPNAFWSSIKHGAIEQSLSALEFVPGNAAWTNPNIYEWQNNTTFNIYGHYPIRLPVGKRILSWSLAANKLTAATATIVATLKELNGTTFSTVGSSQSNAAAAPGAITLGQSGLTQMIVSGRQYMLKVEDNGSGAANDAIRALTFTYDQP